MEERFVINNSVSTCELYPGISVTFLTLSPDNKLTAKMFIVISDFGTQD